MRDPLTASNQLRQRNVSDRTWYGFLAFGLALMSESDSPRSLAAHYRRTKRVSMLMISTGR